MIHIPIATSALSARNLVDQSRGVSAREFYKTPAELSKEEQQSVIELQQSNQRKHRSFKIEKSENKKVQNFIGADDFYISNSESSKSDSGPIEEVKIPVNSVNLVADLKGLE